jgi:hypothetical protein
MTFFFPVTTRLDADAYEAKPYNSGLPFVFYIYFLHNEPAESRIGRKTQGVIQ